jgi:pimeloyl-ACP methyl ester carboxylesterase
MPTMTVDQDRVDLHYHDAGSGQPTVVLIHGFPFNSWQWRPQLETLTDRCRLIVPNLRGFGSSSLSPQPYTIARLADDIAELLLTLKIRRAVICGLSMGGYIAFEYFRRHRDSVSALALVDTRPQPDSDEGKLNRAGMAELARNSGSASVANILLPKLVAPRTRQQQPDLIDKLREMMESAPPQAIVDALMAMASRQDFVPLLRDIDVPTLVLVGSEDAIALPADTREWAANIPESQLAVIAGAGHVSNLEQPSAFDDLLIGFIDALPGGGS